MEGFLKREVEKATSARKAQLVLGCPSEKEFINMVSKETGIKNCPATPVDVANAHTIFGPDLPGVRGKTVRQKPSWVETAVRVPDDYHRLNKFVTLTADVMFVNGYGLLVTFS